MKKRLLSLCMALFFLLALVPGLPAYSAIVSEGPPEFFPEEWGPLTYQIVNIPVSGGYKQEVYILKSNKKTTGDLTIPSALDGYAVTRIEESACSGSKFSSISVPDTVTKIEDKAFMSCPNLTSVSIAGNGTKLGTSLFSGCAKLVDVILPGGITEIPVNTFYGCSSLPDITIPSGVTVIRDSAFQGCSSLAGITIPGSVTGIEPNAFRDCTSLTYASIPSSVTSIGPVHSKAAQA